MTSWSKATARPGVRGMVISAWAVLTIAGATVPRRAIAQSATAEAASPGEVAIADADGQSAIPTKGLLQIMRDGGPLMWPIAACSLLTVTVLFERLVSLRRGRVIPTPFVRRFLHQLRDGQLDREEAAELCEDNGSPVAQVFGAAIRRWGRPAVEVEQAILDAGERATNELRKHVRMFNAVSTITPLLGLLGTVFGMIEAFNAIANSQALGRPDLLASGISQALITTAAGLTVAIPALTCYLYFLSRVDGLVIEIDALGQDVVGVISAEAISYQKSSAGKSRRPDAA